jgi:hypothetical protein
MVLTQLGRWNRGYLAGMRSRCWSNNGKAGRGILHSTIQEELDGIVVILKPFLSCGIQLSHLLRP